jgi:hypothetical protein
LAFHVAAAEGGLAQTSAWLAEQVREANRHFAPAGLAFSVSTVQALAPGHAHVRDADARDAIGAKRTAKGRVDVFVVSSLSDIDEPGEIRGVHWRRRNATEQRFIILSAIAGPFVLAHELGHWFSLPHSTSPASIMNKARDPQRPPVETWGFAEPELRRIRRAAKRAFARGELQRPGRLETRPRGGSSALPR